MAKNHRAFSLIELLIVVAVIAVLAGVVLSINFQKQLQKARDGKRKVDIEQIRSALEMCRSDSGSYPAVGSFTFGSGALTCTCGAGTCTYLNPVPGDPKAPAMQYTYSLVSGYTLTAALEVNAPCSYQATPLGSSTTGAGCP